MTVKARVSGVSTLCWQGSGGGQKGIRRVSEGEVSVKCRRLRLRAGSERGQRGPLAPVLRPTPGTPEGDVTSRMVCTRVALL
eukprot:537397-Prorocentrum_minimum.AAC.1